MAAEDVLEKKGKRRRGKDDDGDTTADSGITAGKGRATPGRRSGDSSSGNFLTNTFGGVSTYFREVMEEVEKVSWPTREETLRLTWIVLLTTIVSAIALGVISLFMSYIIRWGLNTPLILVAIVVGAVAIAGVWIWRSGRSGAGY